VNASRWRGQPGHYEGWHLRLADPATLASAWIRLGFQAPVEGGGQPLAEVWFVGRSEQGEVYARRETFALDRFTTGAGGFPLTVGRCTLDAGTAVGVVDEAAWNLRWDTPAGAIGYGGESRLRRTEIVTTLPAIRAFGTLRIRGREFQVSGWPAHQVHAWGSRHAEVSARMHCNAFPAFGDFVEAVSRRHRSFGVAPRTVTLGAARIGEAEIEAHGTARGLVSTASAGPERYAFTIRGVRVKLEGLVRCRLADLIGVVYRDPDGGRVFAYQTDRGDVEATLYRRGRRGWSEWGRLAAAGCAAYEYASRRPVAGVEVVL
jgi:hypothetical protein